MDVGPRSSVALAQSAARLREQLLEPHGVDGRVPQRVTVGRTDDRLLSERSAQSRDVVLHRVARRGRQLFAPEGVDQLVHRHDPAVAQRKHREEAMALAAAHADRTSTKPDLERPEQPDFQHIDHAKGYQKSHTLDRPREGVS